MSNKGLGDRIAEARERRGFSASELARLTGVTPTAVWNWEKNGTKPRPDAIAAIAKCLGVDERWLLTGSASPSTQETQKVPEIVSRAELAIATVLGFPVERVKLRLEVVPA
jgi:transcriptional regulator with XRE-family HTH domain